MKGSLFKRSTPADPPRAVPSGGARVLTLPALPTAVYAVGDVHGMRRLYAALEAEIVEDARTCGIDGPKLIVLLGDIVDRGPDSAGLIDDLLAPAPIGFQRLVLRGNHEDMMRAFLDNPGQHREWLGYGGDATLLSYGLSPDPTLGFDLPSHQLASMVRTAIPDRHRRFLEELPYGVQLGDYFLCHAGIDPDLPITAQRPEALLWGPPERCDHGPAEMPVIVHGHIPVTDPLISSRRINVDTGAYASGCLTAMRLVTNEAPCPLCVRAEGG